MRYEPVHRGPPINLDMRLCASPPACVVTPLPELLLDGVAGDCLEEVTSEDLKKDSKPLLKLTSGWLKLTSGQLGCCSLVGDVTYFLVLGREGAASLFLVAGGSACVRCELFCLAGGG